MYWTLDRLLIIAIVITLVSVDGLYHAWQQRTDDRIGPRLFATYAAVLVVGSGLTWFGFFLEWAE